MCMMQQHWGSILKKQTLGNQSPFRNAPGHHLSGLHLDKTPEDILITEQNKKEQLQDIFLTQAGYCEELDSPFMARLCRLFATHIADDDAGASYLINLPKPDSFWNLVLALRVAGALHALVLTDQCSNLKAVYPPHHDDTSDEDLWQSVCHAMQSHADFFIPFLDSAPQTNEVRRSSALLPGFLTIAHHTG